MSISLEKAEESSSYKCVCPIHRPQFISKEDEQIEKFCPPLYQQPEAMPSIRK